MTLAERRRRQRQNQQREERDERLELPIFYQPEEAQIGLQQIPGTPFYATPNIPANPRDCNRFPNSPWCGGNPINRQSIIDIGFDLVLDECNVGIQISPTLGFISLPASQLVYRNPNCIPPPPPIPRLPREEVEEFPTIRKNGENNPKPFVGFVSYFWDYEDGVGIYYYERKAEFVDFEEKVFWDRPLRTLGNRPADAKLTLNVSVDYYREGRYVEYFGDAITEAPTFRERGGEISTVPTDPDSIWRLQTSGEIDIYFNYGGGLSFNADVPVNLRKAGVNGSEFLCVRFSRARGGSLGVRGARPDPISGFPLDYHYISRGDFNQGIARSTEGFPIKINSLYEPREINLTGEVGEDIFGTYYPITRGYGIIADSIQTYWFQPGWMPSIPAPIKRKRKMDCCKNNDQLLRLILRRIGNFPVAVPDSYLTVEDKQPKNKTVNSLMELTAWFAERFDEVIGEFEIKIQIDDADLTKEGKQGKTIRLPNLAETVAELFTMQFQQTIYTDLIVHLLTNALVESGQIKQMDFKNHNALMAITEYMGFPYKNISQKLPLTFTPGKETFEELLKESELDVSVIDYVEKGSMAQDIHTLLQAAAIIRAVFYRRAPNDKEALKQQLKEDLTGLVGERAGGIIDIVKEFVGDLNNQYDPTENSESS